MKSPCFIFFLLLVFSAGAQVKIHAHNDYEKPLPLTNALSNKVFSVEADVFLKHDELLVAHSENEISPDKTLNNLYINPLVTRFQKYRGRVSEDSNYRITLMIDVKQGGEEAINAIAKAVKGKQSFFDRSVNPMAVQIIISGDRGKISSWKSFPSFIYFDGRPYETYDSITLQKVAVVSDGYGSYAEDKEKQKTVLTQTHKLGKLFRFWGTPDNEFSWNYFNESGVDIINTDKPEACRKYFESKK